jgi:hypothetical protein
VGLLRLRGISCALLPATVSVSLPVPVTERLPADAENADNDDGTHEDGAVSAPPAAVECLLLNA